jgi:hypothetical protein
MMLVIMAVVTTMVTGPPFARASTVGLQRELAAAAVSSRKQSTLPIHRILGAKEGGE